MSKRTVLTGITTTGPPHLGNYVGAIRPGIEASKDLGTKHFYFLADYHSLAKNEDPDRIVQSTLEIAASWLALGLGFLWQLWDKDKLAWHDRLSGTHLVRCDPT